MSTELKLKTSDVASVQEFGSAVALSGDVCDCRSTPWRIRSTEPLTCLRRTERAGWSRPNSARVTQQRFDHFGEAVGIDGDYAIVGASQAGIGSYGQAYIFHRNGSSGWRDTILFASDKADYARYFGQSVSLGGDWAIVGSDKAAHMFSAHWVDVDWKAKLTADEATDFGRSVSINAKLCRRRSHQYQSIAPDRRSVRLSPERRHLAAAGRPHRERWNHVRLFSDGPFPSVGTTFIVGAPGANASGMIEPGAAYIFWRSGSVWIQQIKLEPTAPHKVKDFGRAVAISGRVMP